MHAAAVCRLNRDAVLRTLAAGTAWGVTFSAGLLALGAAQCALPGPGDVAITTTVSVAAGILTIGPIAAFYSRR